MDDGGLEYDEYRDQQDFLNDIDDKKVRLGRMFNRVEADEFAREKFAEDLKVDRLPYWLHPDADYLAEDSGMNVGDLHDSKI